MRASESDELVPSENEQGGPDCSTGALNWKSVSVDVLLGT
jgi:hypothetical protein